MPAKDHQDCKSSAKETDAAAIAHFVADANVRPRDEAIIKATEISGMNTSEGVVILEEFAKMGEAFKDRLLEVVKQHRENVRHTH
jgi:hypothetical protein